MKHYICFALYFYEKKLNKAIQYLDSIISGERKGLIPAILKAELLTLSFITSKSTKLRRHLYSRGLLPSKELPCKVISIGNVVVGGSGKTPLTITIAKLLKKNTELKLAIASRGYKSRSKGISVVSDGEKILLNIDEAGDESYMMAKKLADVPVIIGKDRYKSGLLAINLWGTEVLILDDGFQYLKLKHNVDLITIDSTETQRLNYILPRGYLREPLASIKNADAIVLTRVDQCNDIDNIYKIIRKIDNTLPIFESIYEPISLVEIGSSKSVSFERLKGSKILAVSGIANPKSFVKTLNFLNPSKINAVSFPDHHNYSQKDIENIEKMAIDSKSDVIITTEKDAYKLINISFIPVLALAIELKFLDLGEKELLNLIYNKIC